MRLFYPEHPNVVRPRKCSSIPTVIPVLGDWLLDPRLVGKKLDVRVKGTILPLWQKGRYKNEIGSIWLKKPLKTVCDSVAVKIGYTQGRVFFRACHLLPEHTTRQPRPFPELATPELRLTSGLGMRVVIIGADLVGNSDFIGQYAYILHCPYRLEGWQACVQVAVGQSHAGCIGYYIEDSLCRSTPS
jgi:hypothetical protein